MALGVASEYGLEGRLSMASESRLDMDSESRLNMASRAAFGYALEGRLDNDQGD